MALYLTKLNWFNEFQNIISLTFRDRFQQYIVATLNFEKYSIKGDHLVQQ